MNASASSVEARVPAVTLGFWLLKIAATTLGETAGDALSMSLGFGYLASTAVFAAVFAIAAALQIRAARFHPWIYWTTIVATTTVGTTLADFADRSLGIGYAGGSLLLAVLLAITVVAWQRSTGTLDVASVSSPRVEAFYWTTILFSQTLGTALGDWVVDGSSLGYGGSALLFGGALALVAAAYYGTAISRPALFWAAFVLTRPLGATLGDFFDKPLDQGGLAFSRFTASATLLAFIVVWLLVVRQRPASAPRSA